MGSPLLEVAKRFRRHVRWAMAYDGTHGGLILSYRGWLLGHGMSLTALVSSNKGQVLGYKTHLIRSQYTFILDLKDVALFLSQAFMS